MWSERHLTHVHRRTNVTLARFTINSTSPSTRPTSPRPMPTSPSVNLTLNPTSPPTRPTSPSRLEERLRCVVRGKSRGYVRDQTFASASRDAVRRRHGDARLCRRLDKLGSITGLRFSLGLRPPLTPMRWPGSQRPGEQGSILAPTPLRMDPEPVSSLLWPRPRGQPTSASWEPLSTPALAAPPDQGPNTIATPPAAQERRAGMGSTTCVFASPPPSPWRTSARSTHHGCRPPRQNLTRIGSEGCRLLSVARPASRRASSPPVRRF
jgi:hypothetical protein